MFRVVGLIVLADALAGCHRDGRSDDQRTASGQVLRGSASDAMIPYEQLQSRPPLAPKVVAKTGKDEAAAGTVDDTGEAATADPAPTAATSIVY